MAVPVQQPRWLDPAVALEYIQDDPNRQRTPAFLLGTLAAAEAFTERYTRRQIGPEPAVATGLGVPVAKVFPVRPGQWRIRIPDLRQASGVTLDSALLTAGTFGYELDDAGDVQDGLATTIRLTNTGLVGLYANVRSTLAITGWWGYYPLPADIADAAYRLFARMYAERKAVWSDSVLTPEGGIMQYFRQLPLSVQATFTAWQKPLIGSARQTQAGAG